MRKFICLFTIIFYSFHFCYTQEIEIKNTKEKQSLFSIIKSFEKTHKLNFSFDVDAVKKIDIVINEENISISTLLKIVKTQTAYKILQESEKDYMVIKKEIEYRAICGKVIDSFSTLELSRANIIINGEVKAITNNQGFFKIKAALSDSIYISYLGFKTAIKKVIEFKKNNCATIALVPEAYELNPVVVRDYLTSGVQKNADGSVTVSTKRLKILPGLIEPDVLTSIQLLPGISSPTEDAAALYFRGGTPGENLILFDGIKMYQTGHFFDQITVFNPYIVSETNVYRGGTSVRYGDRVSGVVDIRTDDNVLDSLVVGGGINLTHADVFIKSPISKKLGFLAAARRSTTDLYDNITTDNLTQKVFQNTRGAMVSSTENQNTNTNATPKDKTLFNDVNFKLLWKTNKKNTFKLSTLFAENTLDNFRIVPDSETEGISFFDDAFKTRNFGTGIQWKKVGDSKIIQNANLYASYFDQHYNLETENERGIFKKQSENIVNDFGAEYSIDIPVSKYNKLHLGYQLAYNKTSLLLSDRGSFPNPEFPFFVFKDIISGKTINHNLFLEYRYTTPRVYFNLGFRNSYLSNLNQFFIEPRIFSSAEIIKNLRVTASLELKNQQLNQYSSSSSLSSSENPSLPISENNWILSNSTSNTSFTDIDGSFNDSFNDTVPLLKSRQFTLGALYSYNGWSIDLEGYYKKIKGVILSNDLEFDIAFNTSPVLDDINTDLSTLPRYPTGEEDRIGLDFLIKKTVRNYRVWLGYALSKTAIDFPFFQKKSFPSKYDQRHVLNISQTLKVKNFEFALGWNYASGRAFTKLIPADIFFGLGIDSRGLNANRFPSYHKLDVSALYRITNNNKFKFVFGASLRNLYNRRNIISQEFNLTSMGGLAVFEPFLNESLRLTPDFVFRVTF